MSTSKHKPEDVLAAIEDAGPKATYSQIAHVLGVTTRTLRNYRDKWKKVSEALDDLRENRHDFVESRLMQGIDDGNPAMIIFYAKTQMRSRGYIERTEIANATDDSGASIPFRIVNYRAGLTETEG